MIHSHPEYRLFDPMWGPDGLYALAAKNGEELFFMQSTRLYNITKDEFVDLELPGRLCAGTFRGNVFYGSFSMDVSRHPIRINQAWFTWDGKHDPVIRYPNWRISDYTGRNGLIACRDPVPHGNHLVVCTGGMRWGCTGNVALIDHDGHIVRKSILSEKLRRTFREIERPCFVDDLMFFSAHEPIGFKPKTKLYVSRFNGDVYDELMPVMSEYGMKAYGMTISDDKTALWVREKERFYIDSGWTIDIGEKECQIRTTS